MSSNLNTVLAECEQQAKKLVEEIAKYRTAGVISDHTALSLEKLCIALQETHKQIKPFETVFARRLVIILGSILFANSVFLVVIMILLITK